MNKNLQYFLISIFISGPKTHSNLKPNIIIDHSVVFTEEERREHWVVRWEEADQLHSWVLKLDYLGSNPGFMTFFLVILVNLLNLTKLHFSHF